jgi:hypothetical protein
MQPVPESSLADAWQLFQWQNQVRYFAKQDEPQRKVLGGWLPNLQALERAERNLTEKGFDLYLQANPSRGHFLKAATRDVTVWRRLIIDLDPFEPECSAVEALQSVLEVADQLIPQLAHSSSLIDSGRGAQAWVHLVPCNVNDQAQLYERALGGFLHCLRAKWQDRLGYRVDTSCSDLARIVRCPGSVNWKTGNRAKMVSLSTSELSNALVLPFANFAPLHELTRPEKISNLVDVLPHLSGLARDFLTTGITWGERHKACYASACNLLDAGMNPDDVPYWLDRGGMRCVPPLDPIDIERAYVQARRRNVR